MSFRYISGLGLCPLLALIGSFVQPVCAQPVAIGNLTLPQGANEIVWDATRSRFFISSGTNVLVVNPETAQIEDTIPIGDHAFQIAVSGDGQFLYVSLGGPSFPSTALGIVGRYQIQSHSLDLQIPLGQYKDPVYGTAEVREVQDMVVLPGKPSSIVVGTTDHLVMVFDGAASRPGTAAVNVSSLYARSSDGAIFGLGDGDGGFGTPRISWLSVSNTGISLSRSVLVDPNWDNGSVTWNGSLVTNRNSGGGSVFDLTAGALIGHIPLTATTGSNGNCVLATDVSGASAIGFQYTFRNPGSTASLIQYSLASLLPIASVSVTGIPTSSGDLSAMCDSVVATWGADGILIHGLYGELFFLHAAGVIPLTPAPVPTPTLDTNGVIHLALQANGLIYDSARNVLWASIPGIAAADGNSVVSIDPGTGTVTDSIYAGSEPDSLALSADGSHLFATLAGTPAIASIDLSAKRSTTFSVSNPSESLYWEPGGVAAIAGEGNSVVAILGAPPGQYGGYNSRVIAYDAGIPRKNTFDNSGPTISEFVTTIFPTDSPNAIYAADAALHYSDGSHQIFRLAVNPAGVTFDRQLNNLVFGTVNAAQPASMIYDTGRLFTSGVQMVAPDTSQILGSFALTPQYGLPVPFSDRNSVVYVQSYASQISANLYDLATFRPTASVLLLPPCLCITPQVNVIAAVRAGASSIAIAANGEIVIAPLASFQALPSTSVTLQSVSPGVQQISLPVNAMGVLPGASTLLLATPSTAGSLGNSIVTFNPATNQIESAVFIGSEPSNLSIALDGSAVYAYLSGEDRVARLNTATGSRDLEFIPDPTGGATQYGVFDMAVGPDGGLAVSYSGAIDTEGSINVTGVDGTIAIFDNGVLRPQVDPNSDGPDANDPATFALAFNDSGSRLYAYNSFLSTFELKREAVSPLGVQWLSSTGGLMTEFNAQIKYAHGFLYTSYGTVVDPERSVIAGQFTDGWLTGTGATVVPDVAGGRVYFATASGILVFDINSRALLGRLAINLGSNSPQSLMRFGSDGLAFLANGKVYVVSIGAIPLLSTPIGSPQLPFIAANGIVPVYSSVPSVQAGSWISIFGANLAGTDASWDGSFPKSLAGTTVSIDSTPGYLWYVSPSQINMQVPDDSATGTVKVTVTTPNGTATGSVSLSPFGPSLSLFDSQHVAGEIVTPDGSGAYGGGTYDLVGPAGFFGFTTRPAKPGEALVLYGVGFGPTDTPVLAGQSFSGADPTINSVIIRIGGQPAKVLFSGLVAAGLYQINVVVPPTPPGEQTIQATVGGINAPSALVTVQ